MRDQPVHEVGRGEAPGRRRGPHRPLEAVAMTLDISGRPPVDLAQLGMDARYRARHRLEGFAGRQAGRRILGHQLREPGRQRTAVAHEREVGRSFGHEKTSRAFLIKANDAAPSVTRGPVEVRRRRREAHDAGGGLVLPGVGTRSRKQTLARRRGRC